MSCCEPLREYEARYEIASDGMEQEVAKGRMRETAEVSRWVVAWRSFRSNEISAIDALTTFIRTSHQEN